MWYPSLLATLTLTPILTQAQVAPAGEVLWLGLYHNETRLGPARGWERCVSGDAPSFSNWLSDPTDSYGAPV